MKHTTLYITDEHTATGYREATLEEIMATARRALNRKVHRGTLSSRYPRPPIKFIQCLP